MIGDLDKETKSKRVVKPQFTTEFLGAVREGAHLVCACEGSGAAPRMWENKRPSKAGPLGNPFEEPGHIGQKPWKVLNKVRV